MRLGGVPVIPYCLPGSPEIVPSILAQAAHHSGILTANHGPVVAAPTLRAAVFVMEELEDTAKLMHLAHGLPTRQLLHEQVNELKMKSPIP